MRVSVVSSNTGWRWRLTDRERPILQGVTPTLASAQASGRVAAAAVSALERIGRRRT